MKRLVVPDCCHHLRRSCSMAVARLALCGKKGQLAALAVVTALLLVYLVHVNSLLRQYLAPASSSSSETVSDLPLLERPGYVVWSPSCQIPDFDPFDESIAGLLKPAPPIVCSKWPPLTHVMRLEEKRRKGRPHLRHVLRVDPGLVSKYVPEGQTLSCCYANVTRFTISDSDDGDFDGYYNISACMDFEKEVQLNPEEEFILVRCVAFQNEQQNQTKEVYKNMHSAVSIKRSVAENLKERKSPADDSRLNVLLLLIDSMSPLNLRRTMPRTVAVLKRTGYVELRGYNKIGYDSRPNIMAVLAGRSDENCRDNLKFDNCSFIWKEFHNKSYVSAYAEDEPSTFYWDGGGFVKQPTDYFFQPYFRAAYDELKVKYRHTYRVCAGPQTVTDHLLGYAMDFVLTFKNYFYFGLFWLNNFSHDDVTDPGAMDSRMEHFFNELSGTGTYNNTVVFFLSDHGRIYRAVRGTYLGWLEERSPFIYILFPPWFESKYPETYRNVLMNQNRLTSPYDLHVTLKDILHERLNNSSPSGNVSFACPKCTSLLSKDFGDRSCEDAGISPEYCTCTQFNSIPKNDSIVEDAANYALEEIQKILKEAPPNVCADLSLNKIIDARTKIDEYESDPFYIDYKIQFETQPGGGQFESSLRRDVFDGNFSLKTTIIRTNAYGNQSHCVHEGILKQYCFCIST